MSAFNMSQDNDLKYHFDVLYATLCEIQKGFVANTAKVTGFLLLAIGWIATSDGARNFLKSNDIFKDIAIMSLGGVFLLYIFASILAFRSSQYTFLQLKNLNFMPSEYYNQRKVDLFTVIICIVGNLLIGVFLGYFVFKII